jgi:hypothetical protein
MKPNINLNEDNNSNEDSWAELLDDSSTRSTSDIHIPYEKKFTILPNKSLNYIFPLIYFFSSALFLFILLVVNVYKDNMTRDNFENMPLHPFPGFSSLKEWQPKIYSINILIISISGLLNVWFFSSLLLQRFSVPELKNNKPTVHLMFILGIFGNIIYLFFGFSPELLKLETDSIHVMKISLSMIIFLSFVFFNLLFATLTLNVFSNFKERIAPNDLRLKRNIRGKKYTVYLTIFTITIYMLSIGIDYTYLSKNNKKQIYNSKFHKIISFLLLILPYVLFVLISLINLSYYFDVIYLEDVINKIIDREFFMNEDTNVLLLQI